jgi:hypothetical protein
MVSCCGGGLAVRRAAAWYYVLGVKEDAWWWANVCPKHVELILKINKYCYLLHLVGLDFITLPALNVHGQTQIKFSKAFFPTFRFFSDTTKYLWRVLSDVSKDCGEFIFKRREDKSTTILRNVGTHSMTLRDTWRYGFSKPFNLLKPDLQWNTARIVSSDLTEHRVRT